MGTEIIYPIAWFIGACALVLLIIRSWKAESRPYALPTLVLSVAIALALAWNDYAVDVYRNPQHTPAYGHYFLVWISLPALILGLQAHLVRWLVGRKIKSAP